MSKKRIKNRTQELSNELKKKGIYIQLSTADKIKMRTDIEKVRKQIINLILSSD